MTVSNTGLSVRKNSVDAEKIANSLNVSRFLGVLESMPDAITIFVQPRNIQELERRLRGRKSEPEAGIQRRLEVAREELRQADWYQHVVVNDEVSETSREICRLLHTYK